MRKTFTTAIFLFLLGTLFAQLPKKVMKKMGENPALFLDSVEIDISVAQTLNPFNIANISIVKPKKAKKLIGGKGVDGAIYITTVKAAKRYYWSFFRTKSEEYYQLLNSPKADSIVQYILNRHPLSDTAAPGSLFLINDKNFKSIQVIETGKSLSSNTEPKRYTVIIRARRPKGLVKTTTSK